MAERYLIDTNVMIDFAALRLPENAHNRVSQIIDDNPRISIINEIELLGFSVVPQSIRDFVADTVVLPLNQEVTDQTIVIRKSYKIKLPDAIIAATAVTNELTLLTRNTTDFQGLAGLTIEDPHNFT